MKQLSITFAALVAAVLAACNAESEATDAKAEIPFVPGQGSAEKLTDAERNVAQRAIDALAAELQIAKDGIEVDTIRAVDWPDSSIGCPQPGQAYLQVITPGHKVTLRANGAIHVVHEAKGSAFVCQKTKAATGITPELEFVFGEQMIVAKKDLASRLRISDSGIRPKSGVQQTWDDASMGCPEPGKTYPPGKVTGWVLTLSDGKLDYTYHTDMHRTIPCPAITHR